MAAQLTYNDNATTVRNAINTDAGATIVTGQMDAGQVVSAVNTEYGTGTVSVSMNAHQFVDALNNAFDGGTPMPAKTSFTFLHVSDPHGFAVGLNQAKTELDNDSTIDALLFTGDYTGHAIINNAASKAGMTYNGTVLTTSTRTTAITTSEVNASLNSIKAAHGEKLLMSVGNHDAYDNANGYGSQQIATTAIKGWMTDGVVTWGDTSGVASYWHKDYTLSATSKLRIINLDQYENTKLGKRGQFQYWPLYTQAQMDWLVARLKELTADDYLIIMMHEPAYQDDTAIPTMLANVMTDGEKLFISEDLSKFNYKGDTTSINLLPRIIDAYLKGVNASLTYENLNNGASGTANNTTITVNASFAGNAPCRFLFYIGGHRHCDIVSPLPSPYGDQMMMHIAAADWVVASSADNDLLSHAQESYPSTYNANDCNEKVSGNADYCINKVVIDFEKGTINIDRIGASKTNGGRTRNTITFTT